MKAFLLKELPVVAVFVLCVTLWFGVWWAAALTLVAWGTIHLLTRNRGGPDEGVGALAASDPGEAGKSIEVTREGDGDHSQLRVGEPTITYSRHGSASWRLEMRHEGLNKHRVFKASDPSELSIKASLQATEWDNRWGKVRERERGVEAAAARTNDAQAALDALEETLERGVARNSSGVWAALKDRSPFPAAAPVEPTRTLNPPEPRRDDAAFRVQPSLSDTLLGRGARLRAEAEERWRKAVDAWEEDVRRLDASYDEALREFEEAQDQWSSEKAKYEERQRRSNAAVDVTRMRYDRGEAAALEDLVGLVLSASEYPDWMPQRFELKMRTESKTLLLTYSLPAFGEMPRLREVTFVASRREMQEKNMTELQARALYDSVLYQVVLRTDHEIFRADYRRAVTAIVLNGMVTDTKPSDGKIATTCILSLHITRDEMNGVDLAKVDPKACFKALKGVGSSSLYSMTAVAPIMDVRRDDARFVPSRGVAGSLDDSVNLAQMDWEDFEHLTRELFEEEFRSQGGEVRVTQSSRDGGVDAIAFDPDPIRGGKVVIQAKRYTNTVGVAAVRDLYGTVLNEGATKGILVTTSDYGPDAYRFAKNKPLTLMNGANLLHLLEKHGHRARIDL